MKIIKIGFSIVMYQFYMIPYVKITYSRDLNGDIELSIGWINREISIRF